MALATVTLTANQLTVAVTGGSGDLRDWVGLFRAGVRVDWKYLANNRQNPRPKTGVTEGSVDLNLGSAPMGVYEVRLMTATGAATYTIQPSNSLTATIVSVAADPPPPPPPPPPVAKPLSLALSPASVLLPNNATVGTIVSTATVAMSDDSAFAGTIVATPVGLLLAGTRGILVLARDITASDVGAGTYTVTALQNGASAMAALQLSIAAAPPPPPPSDSIGYTARVQMGNPPAGVVYVFDPDSPGAGQAAINRGNFTSDFAPFVQGSIETTRTDTPFRVLFRKDVSPDPNRFEAILELGHPTTDGSAANSGPFTFTIFQGSTQVFRGTFPSMGWFTRWRWNPTPRPEVRSRASLLPSGLNLIPNFSAAMAATLRCADCGAAPGFPAYSSYSAAGNPLGVNENCGLASYTGGVGDRADIGVCTDWQAEYIIRGNALAQQTMYVHAEVAGGMPWAIRDPATGGPVDLVADPTIVFGAGDGGGYDTPTVLVPSSGDKWFLESNHLPSLSCVPYLLTGDPFYLENHQFAANWTVGQNWWHRSNGYMVNYADANSPVADNPGGTIPLLQGWRLSSRGLGWTLRDWGMFHRATPLSVPGWLQSKAYAKSMLDQNRVWAENNSGCPTGSGPNNAYVKANYTGLVAFGSAPAAVDFEEGFFVSFMLMGLGYLVNQAGFADWRPLFDYMARLPVGLASGIGGWPSNWPSPYNIAIQPMSTDYDGNPMAITNFAELWDYSWKNATYAGSYWGSGGSPGYRSAFPEWKPSTLYTCNSWIFEVRTGIPVLPNVGDVASLIISGKFAGSPVTAQHTMTAADVAYYASLYSTSPGEPNTLPLDDLIARVNASAAGAAGIVAGSKNTATIGYWFDRAMPGRLYLSFDSSKVGDIVVSGAYTSVGPNAHSSVYVQPNGDGVNHGVAGRNLLGRPLQYQAATTGTSGISGPVGQQLQSPTVADGTVKWCYVPECKSAAFLVPSPDVPKAPTLAQLFATLPHGNPQPHYAVQAWAGMNGAVAAGVPGAAGAAANIKATVEDWFANWDKNVRNRYAFCIAP